MSLRTRKLLGSILIIVWLTVFALVAMALIGKMSRPNMLVELIMYAVLGFAWILPLKPLFVWMGKGRG